MSIARHRDSVGQEEQVVPEGQVPESKEAEVPHQDEFGQLDANVSSNPQDQQQLQENMSNARGQAGRSIDPSTGVPGNPDPDSYAANHDQRRNAGYNADGNAGDGRDIREGGSNRGRPAGDGGYGSITHNRAYMQVLAET